LWAGLQDDIFGERLVLGDHLVDDERESMGMLNNLTDATLSYLLGDLLSLEDLCAELRSNIETRSCRLDEIGAEDNTSKVFGQVLVKGDTQSRGRRLEEIGDVVRQDLILEEDIVRIIVKVEPVIGTLHFYE
jgi:hypothetical protein